MDYAREWLLAEWHYNEIMANDYVISCSLNHPVAEWAGWFNPEHQKKVVVVLNGTTSHVPRCGLYNTVVGSQKWKELLLYGRTQFYGTPFEATYGGSIEPVPEEAFLGVVPFWTDANFYTPGESPKEDYFLFLSRPTAYKGLAQALELAGERKLHLKIVPGLGHASHSVELEQHRPQIEAAIARGAKVDVIAIPQTSHHHVLKRELYRRARALLAPVQGHEPFGLTLIESMACNTPVIASHMGAFPEIIKPGETGFLCRNKAEYLEAIDRVADLPHEAPRADAESRWHYVRAAQDYMRLLEDK